MSKHTMTKIKNDPWRALSSKAFQKEDHVNEFMISTIDEPIVVEKDVDKAMDLAAIARRLAFIVDSDHLRSLAEAYRGSVFRLAGNYALAERHLNRASSLCTCTVCEINVRIRTAVVEAYKGDIDACLSGVEEAVSLSTGLDIFDPVERILYCDALVARSTVSYLAGRNSEGIDDVCSAISMMSASSPFRLFVSCLLATLALSTVGDDRITRQGLQELRSLREMLKGERGLPEGILGYIAWIRGLAYFCDGNNDDAIDLLETAISQFDRLNENQGYSPELRVAKIDLALVRSTCPQQSTQSRHIKRLIKECESLIEDERNWKGSDTSIKAAIESAFETPEYSQVKNVRELLPTCVPLVEPRSGRSSGCDVLI